jgi:hypothetical protein
MVWFSRKSSCVKERMSIGRKAHNDIQIDNMAISGEHAAVVTILSDSFLEDLNSTNGTSGQRSAGQEALPQGRRRHRAGQVQDEVSGRSPVASDEASDYAECCSSRRPIPLAGSISHGSRCAGRHHGAGSQCRRPRCLPAAAIRLLSGSNAGHQLPLTKTLTTLGRAWAGGGDCSGAAGLLSLRTSKEPPSRLLNGQVD